MDKEEARILDLEEALHESQQSVIHLSGLLRDAEHWESVADRQRTRILELETENQDLTLRLEVSRDQIQDWKNWLRSVRVDIANGPFSD